MTQPSIIVDETAQENGLAIMLADLLRQNMEQHPEKNRVFSWLRGSVAISAPDAEVDLTMFFNRGSCVVFDGIVGKPDLHIEANSEEILGLSNIPLKFGIPDMLSKQGQDLVKKLLTRKIRIAGLPFHPITLTLLTNLLSVA